MKDPDTTGFFFIMLSFTIVMQVILAVMMKEQHDLISRLEDKVYKSHHSLSEDLHESRRSIENDILELRIEQIRAH
jgi:hypothetical protein